MVIWGVMEEQAKPGPYYERLRKEREMSQSDGPERDRSDYAEIPGGTHGHPSESQVCSAWQEARIVYLMPGWVVWRLSLSF
jgi:hypothetical protein